MSHNTFGSVFGGVIGNTSSVFHPTDIDDLIGWWDPSQEGTITPDPISDLIVTSIADLSGSNNTLAQETFTNMPTTGTNKIHGLNVIQFDGANDFLVATLESLSSDLTIFDVCKMEDANNVNDSIYCFNSTSDADFQVQAETIDKFFAQINSSGLGGGGGCQMNTSVHNKDLLLTHRLELDSGMTCYRDGILQTGTSVYTTTIDSDQFLNIATNRAGSTHIEMSQGELIVYNRALDTSEINEVTNYLMFKWGL